LPQIRLQKVVRVSSLARPALVDIISRRYAESVALKKEQVMAEYLGKDFAKTDVVLDGNSYMQCSFTECNMVYRGGQIPQIRGCRIERCRWIWEEGAIRTIQFLKGIYSGLGQGGRELVDDVVKEIRTPFPKGVV
jgi:hypothetical protein